MENGGTVAIRKLRRLKNDSIDILFFGLLPLAFGGFAQTPRTPRLPFPRTFPATDLPSTTSCTPANRTTAASSSCATVRLCGRTTTPRGKAKSVTPSCCRTATFCSHISSALSEITPDKKVVWSYDAPAGYEIHTAAAHRKRPCAVHCERRSPRRTCGETSSLV